MNKKSSFHIPRLTQGLIFLCKHDLIERFSSPFQTSMSSYPPSWSGVRQQKRLTLCSSVQEKEDQGVRTSLQYAVWIVLGHFSQTKPLSICCQSFPVNCKRQQSAFLDEHLDIFSGPEWASCRGYILKIFRPLAGLSKRPNINFPTPLFQNRPKSTLPSSCSHKLLMVASEARSERSVTI